MKKNKGFTLIELIAVITMLAVIALVTVPAVNNAIIKSKDKAYETQKNAIITAAKEWNLENIGSDLGKKQVCYDVLFIMDISGSMEGTRFTNTVNAMNDIMKLLMSSNSGNRMELILYEVTASTFLTLDHYTSNNVNKNVLVVNNTSTFSVAENVENSSNVIITKSASTGNTTFAQGGIKLGIDEYLTVTSTETKRNIPVIMLLTDGSPNSISTDYINVPSGTRSSNLTAQYYTILTSQYYKNFLNTYTGKETKFYTIGLDLDSASSIAFLDPVPAKLANYTALRDMLESSSNPIKPYNYADMSFTGANMSQEDILNIFKEALADAISDTGKVNIQTLVEDGYIEASALTDPRTGEKMDGYIDVIYDALENKYTYEYKEN